MSKKTSIILSILPLILLTFVVFRYSVNIPYWDQWELVPLLQKSYEGNLTFNDFWIPHNEHRPVFPRLIMLGLARLTNWNIRWELIVNILLGIGIYFVILKSLFLSAVNAKKSWPTSAAVVALIIFSLTQWENWVWGWQIQVFLNVFAVCLGFYFLTKSYNNKIYFIASILCGIIATFSFGNGLLFWPLGFLLLRLRTRPGIRSQAWFIVSILIYAIYLPGLPTQFDILSVFNNLLLYLSYVTAYLGAPVFGLQPQVSSIFGIIGLGIFIIFFAEKRLFFLSLGLYAILSAFFTGLGRYHLGGLQAISSRYITFGNLLWLSNIVFLFYARGPVARQPQNPPARGPRFWGSPISRHPLPLIVIIVFLITVTSLYRIKTIAKRDMKKLYYNDEVVKERMKILDEIFQK